MTHTSAYLTRLHRRHFGTILLAAFGLLSLAAQPGMTQVTASSWGWNYYGQLGNDGDINRVHIDTSTPVPVFNLTGLERKTI